MKTLIINGHPDLTSFTSQVAKKLFENRKNAELLNVAELDFNPVFPGYGNQTEFENDLSIAQEKISRADHIILLTPIWWSTYPALLKGFFDRVLMPGFAFKYTKGKFLPEKLLSGRTAELYLFSDAPGWFRRFLMGDPAAKILKRDILGFCGIKVKKIKRLGSMNKLSSDTRENFLLSI